MRLARTPKCHFAFDGDCVYGFGLLGILSHFFAFARGAGPDNKSAMAINSNLPRAPDAFALAKAAIEHIVRARIRLRPITFATLCVVAAVDDERPDIIFSGAGDDRVGEREMQIHAMLVARLVIVEAHPRAGRKVWLAHTTVLSATFNIRAAGIQSDTASSEEESKIPYRESNLT